MTNKLPTINIKGKDYVQVKDRVLAFNEKYLNGCIQTEIVSPLDSKTIIVKAIVIPDVKNPDRKFTDFSQAVIGQGYINTTSALENASTSAVGRALAYMGIGVIESVASADEVVKASNFNAGSPTQPDTDPAWISNPPEATTGRRCGIHNKPLLQGTSKDKVDKDGKPKKYWYHPVENGGLCFGNKV
jgi:hypothetical protein